MITSIARGFNAIPSRSRRSSLFFRRWQPRGNATFKWKSWTVLAIVGRYIFPRQRQALMGYIDFSSKYCQILRFITVTVTGFSKRNRRFLRPTRVVIEIATMDGYSYRVPFDLIIDYGCIEWIDQKSEIRGKLKRSSLSLRYVISLIFQKLRKPQWIFMKLRFH